MRDKRGFFHSRRWISTDTFEIKTQKSRLPIAETTYGYAMRIRSEK